MRQLSQEQYEAWHQKQCSEILQAIPSGVPLWKKAGSMGQSVMLGSESYPLRGIQKLLGWHLAWKNEISVLQWVVSDASHISEQNLAVQIPAKGGSRWAVFEPVSIGKGSLGGTVNVPRQLFMPEHSAIRKLIELLDSYSGFKLLSKLISLPNMIGLGLRFLGQTPEIVERNLGHIWRQISDARLTLTHSSKLDSVRELELLAAAAQLVADELQHTGGIQQSLETKRAISRDELSVAVSDICRESVQLGLVPYELWTSGKMELRPGLLAGERSRRAHGFGQTRIALHRYLGKCVPETRIATDWFLHQMQVFPASWLALAWSYQHGLPMVADACVLWRSIGQMWLRKLRHLSSVQELNYVSLSTLDGTIERLWRSILHRHRRSAWIHDIHRRLYADLRHDVRWNRHILIPRLVNRVAKVQVANEASRPSSVQIEVAKKVQTPFLSRHQSLDQLPLGILQLTELGAALEVGSKINTDESSQFTELLNAAWPSKTDQPANWQEVLSRLEPLQYRRRPMIKSGGGVRMLDIPDGPLRDVQRVLGRLLTAIFPANGNCAAYLPHRGVPYHARAHAGARVAIQLDLQDFYGSVRPRQLEPWLALSTGRWQPSTPLEEWSEEGRRAVLHLLFCKRGNRAPYLAQGAPSSPAASNLAGCGMDFMIQRRAQQQLGPGQFTYTRYADDLVLSTNSDTDPVAWSKRAVEVVSESAREMRWQINHQKSKFWRADRGQPLIVCGVRVPDSVQGEQLLVGEHARNVRAALQQLRTRSRVVSSSRVDFQQAHGTVCYAYGVTGDPGYLAYTLVPLRQLAVELAGPLLAESIFLGWSDMVYSN